MTEFMCNDKNTLKVVSPQFLGNIWEIFLCFLLGPLDPSLSEVERDPNVVDDPQDDFVHFATETILFVLFDGQELIN